jgi:hypothetical protein
MPKALAQESNEDAIETEIEEMFADAEPLPEETAA